MSKRTAKRIRNKNKKKKKIVCPYGKFYCEDHKEEKNEKKKKELTLLCTVEPESVNRICGDWEEVEIAVDSGATETVLGEGMLASVETKPGDASRRGVKYEVADGTLIDNLGEKRFVAESEEGVKRRFTAQITEVNKALLSVYKLVKSGHRVVFEESGSYIEDVKTGEVMALKEQGGMFMLKLWVPRGAGF